MHVSTYSRNILNEIQFNGYHFSATDLIFQFIGASLSGKYLRIKYDQIQSMESVRKFM